MTPRGSVRAGSDAALEEALVLVRAGLAPLAPELRAEGMPESGWEGQLIRPLVGFAGASATGMAASASNGVRPPLWYALAAVQLAHEASLLHDDVIDGADSRRGVATLAAGRGVAAALVEGDHLLTTSYRLAARTGNLTWIELFAVAVERTVAGEKAQGRSAGRTLEWPEYEAIVLGKSGALLGAALAAGPALGGAGDPWTYFELGRRLGLVYQMLDDLLDYCPDVDTGKPALADRRRGLWTWPLSYVDAAPETEPEEVARLMREPGDDGVSPLARCVDRLRAEADKVAEEAALLMPGDRIVPAMLRSWIEAAESAAAPSPLTVVLPPVTGWESLMAERAKSFRFASRLFPPGRRTQVAGVYAWCRYTDDLVDGVDLPGPELEARLDAWLDLSRRAYDGEATGNDLADRVMTDMRAGGVPFGYAAELIEGMRMDVRGTDYGTLTELRRYTYRVASVVGLWMTELFGVRDPWMLDRAAALGHAMQLTNILRDVGEDLRSGRVYLPTMWLAGHGLGREDLERMMESGIVEPAYAELIESLLQVAEKEYALADPAIDRLPAFFGRPVAVAADVYRGIHDRIRDNGYDNLGLRAHTTLADKVRLGLGAFGRRGGRGVRNGSGAGLGLALGLAMLLVAAPAQPQAPADTAAGSSETGSMRAPTTLLQEVRDQVGPVWLRAVDDPGAVAEGLERVEALRPAAETDAAPAAGLLLRAYEGSFLALRAKHGGWPPARLRNLRSGFELLDAVVTEAPDAPELRYVRLMTGFYLPSVFGRKEAVEADLAALARLLPGSRDRFPAELLPSVIDFVLQHGRLDPVDRERLEAMRP